jgi:small subunit ribosomal protein S17
MRKVLEGVVVSIKMQKTAVVELTRKYHHPLYKKLIKKDRKLNVDTGDLKLNIEDRVKITETKPISKTKHFKVVEVVKK